jgi:hypothetical protein
MAAFYFGSDDADGATTEELIAEGRKIQAEMRAEENGTTVAEELAKINKEREEMEAADRAYDEQNEADSAIEITRTMADLVYEVTGEDVNMLDATEYRQLRTETTRRTTPAEREAYFATGKLPVCCLDEADYLSRPGMQIIA